MSRQQYADELNTKYLLDESSLINVVIKGVDVYICHSLRNHWATNSQADLADTEFQEYLLTAIKKDENSRRKPNTKATDSQDHKIQSIGTMTMLRWL